MKRVLPPSYFQVAIVTILLCHFLVPLKQFAYYPWNLLGLLPMAAGIVLNLVADAVFKKAQTTVKPFETSTALITTGVFRISRHPMYLGMLLILIGLVILLGSCSPFIIVAIFAIVMEVVFVKVEEKMLEQTFGVAWNAYKQQVRKWI